MEMKFIMSYSGGKDSALALSDMLKEGHICMGLLVMINKDMKRSWFHGIDEALLKDIGNALGLPLILCESDGEHYHLAMEKALKEEKAKGAQACVFGDIDILEHRTWCEDRAEQAGMKALFPLWQMKRESIVIRSIQEGFRSIIKCVNSQYLHSGCLGKELSIELLHVYKKKEFDVCGENGEYHTICVDGPIFQQAVSYQVGEQLTFSNLKVIDIRKEETNEKI